VLRPTQIGKSSLTLKKFGKITINKKDGEGTLYIEDDNKGPVVIKNVNGAGHVYLRTKGDKEIGVEDGPGDVLWKVEPPSIGMKNGTGTVKKEE
jgi:hypothetical protein